jgi:hypothetical protein
MISELQRRLGETSGSVFWPAEHLYDSLNAALIELYALGRWQQTSVAVRALPEEEFIGLPQALMVPRYIQTDEGMYLPTTHQRLEQYNREWRLTAAARPEFFVLWDAEHLRPWPVPDVEYEIDIYGTPWPPEISASNTSIEGLDEDLRKGVIHKAAAQLLEHTMPNAAETHAQISQRHLQAFQRRVRNSNPRLRKVEPGTKFQLTRGGHIKLGGLI